MTALEFSKLVKSARRRAGSEWWDGRCPGHDDRRASLSFRDGDEGLIVECHAGCAFDTIAASVRRPVTDFFFTQKNGADPVTRFEIRDAAGQLVAVHARRQTPTGKQVWWEQPNGTRGLGGRAVGDLPLYRIEHLGGADVVVVEGEPPADALAIHGITAVATVTGAAATPSDASLRPLLAHRPVILWADHDALGRAHMARVAARLRALGHDDVRTLRWPEAREPGDDAADFFARGGMAEACRALLAAASPAAVDEETIASTEPELVREGLDLSIAWPDGARFLLAAIRDGREGVKGELLVMHAGRRLSWGNWSLSSIPARETLRKKLESKAPGQPWGEYVEEAAFRLTQAARIGEPLVTLTGAVTSPTRELLPRFLYEGEPTLGFGDGETGKSLTGAAMAVAVQSGSALPFGLKPLRAVPVAYLDWETSQATLDERVALLSAGLGVDPPPILYKRMARPLIDEAAQLAADFARRGVGLVVVDSMMFAVSASEGSGFHEPITAFYTALRLFAPAAVLVLSHVTGADARSGAAARPYGGAFAFNGPRLIWEAKRDKDVTDATAVAFTCIKANNLARRPEPFGLRFQPGEGTITVYPFDLTEAAPDTVAGATPSFRARLLLRTADMTTPQIAKALDISDAAARTMLSRLEAKGVVANRGVEGKATLWGLVVRN